MLQTRTCVAAHCDQCGATPGTDEYEEHWPTEDDALEAAEAAEWHTEDLPRLLCSGCHAVLSCEGTGHEFTGWRRCRCEQLVPAHHPGPGGVCGTAFRYCLRCSLHESRPAPDRELGYGQIPALDDAAITMAALFADVPPQTEPTTGGAQ